jgi:YVTN family beta-propeller protein
MKRGGNLVFWLNVLMLLGLGFFSTMHAAPFVYIPNSGGNTVSVIDAATNGVVKTITVGIGPRGVAMAVTSSETLIYVTNFGSDTVSVIRTYRDALSNVVFEKVRDINVGKNPHGIAVDPAGTYAYVTNSGDSTVSRIDLGSYAVLTVIPVGSNPIGIVVSPDGTKVYAANNSSGTVSVISTADTTDIATVLVGSNPFGVAVNPSGTFVYVANAGDNSLSIIKTADNSVTTKWDLHFSIPRGVAVNPAGTVVYVTNFNSASVSLFDAGSTTVNNPNIIVGTNPLGVSLSSDGMFTYVANSGQGTVSVVNNTTNTVSGNVPAGTSPYALGSFTAPVGTTTPTVTTTTPANNATEISTDATIWATFSDTMDAATITTSTFLLSGGVTGTVTYDNVTKTATFRPSASLAKKTTYTATLTTGIRNITGNALASNYSWSFTTSEKGGDSCFIATAVYGSYDDVHVRVLRSFRDEYLLSNPAGEAMVNAYYRYSPPIATFIKEHDSLRTPVKWALAPVVYAIQYPLQLAFMLGFGLIVIIGKRRGHLWRR